MPGLSDDFNTKWYQKIMYITYGGNLIVIFKTIINSYPKLLCQDRSNSLFMEILKKCIVPIDISINT